MQSIYLDHAAATPLDSDVLAAMQPHFSEQFYNPSALYQAARGTRKTLEDARAKVAKIIGVRPSEIIFTAGGTESVNLAIHGVMRRWPSAHMVTSTIEHDAVLATAQRYDHTQVGVRPDGLVDMQQLAASITEHTVLVSIMYANNEIGTVQPIVKVGQLIKQIRDERRKAGNQTPLLFHTDACQAANYLDIHVSRLGVDLLTLNGGKIYGPKQSGVLYVKGGLVLEPLIDGGGQEHGLRSGTENVAACLGFAEALEKTQVMRHDEAHRLQGLQRDFMKQIAAAVPRVIFRGSLKQRLPNNVHFTIPGTDNERLLIQLDEAGIQAAAGSACSASSDTPSHVLRAIGLSDDEARASLRMTLGRATTAEQLQSTVDHLRKIVA